MKMLWETINQGFEDEDVRLAVDEIIKKSKDLESQKYYELALSCIDLTTLNSTDTQAQGEKFASNVSHFSETFPGLPNVAAICVYPTLVESVKKALQAPGVKIASVSAGFPSSQTFLDVKVLETIMAINKGADEIDNLGSFVRNETSKYVDYMKDHGHYSEAYFSIGTDVVDEVNKLVPAIREKFPDIVFFGGQLVFTNESMMDRWLHNYTVFAVQQNLYVHGIPFVILPVKV